MNNQFIILTIIAIIIITVFFLFKRPKEITEMDMTSAFAELEKWINENASPLQSNLNPPATLGEITEVENNLGIKFPQEVIDAYLIHNGESQNSDGLFGCWKWLSLNEVSRIHVEHTEIEKENNFDDFNPDVMIPLFQSGGGDLYYVESGSLGELIEWWHEQPTRNVISKNLETFFVEFVQNLKNGQYVFIEDDLSALVDKNDL